MARSPAWKGSCILRPVVLRWAGTETSPVPAS